MNNEQNDSAILLKEVEIGCRYAAESIDCSIPYAESETLKTLLAEKKKQHLSLGERALDELGRLGEKPCKDHPVKETMMRLNIHLSLSLSESEDRIAELLINGCNMGMKSVARKMTGAKEASQTALRLAEELIRIERDMLIDLLPYLA